MIAGISSVAQLCQTVTTWTAARQASLCITNSRSLPKLMSIELVMPSNHLILCLPLLFPLSIFPSIRVFSNESALCIRWPKYWSFSFSISPSNEYSGLISFRMDWLDLLAVQGILKSLIQHHSPKASIFWRSAFFIVQLSYPYMTTGNIFQNNLMGKVLWPWKPVKQQQCPMSFCLRLQRKARSVQLGIPVTPTNSLKAWRAQKTALEQSITGSARIQLLGQQLGKHKQKNTQSIIFLCKYFFEVLLMKCFISPCPEYWNISGI